MCLCVLECGGLRGGGVNLSEVLLVDELVLVDIVSLDLSSASEIIISNGVLKSIVSIVSNIVDISISRSCGTVRSLLSLGSSRLFP